MKVVILVGLVLLVMVLAKCDLDKDFKHTNIILIGATGDLAQKYLWRSLFDFFGKHYKHGKHAFSIYASSRKSPDAGRQFLSDILLKVITCAQDDLDCKATKKKFVEAIQYHQLKTEKHYENLASKVNENIQSMYGLQGSPLSPEDGRLIYLSIPPSAYIKTVKMVSKYLRPVVGHPWFRVVIEKPFGHDYQSAKLLIEKLNEYLKEKEIYMADHYLGKAVVKEILPFRYLNKESYEPMWNKHHIERVEVVMKEKLDVQGRVSFYDDVGVIRDVMQNHLTEIATLIGMDLPENSGIIRDILNSKFNFLQDVDPLTERGIIVGQYRSYMEQCQKELSNGLNSTNTPTFAAALFSVNNPRWHGVPFVLVSGKRLDEKLSYVRVVFKNSDFHITETRARSSTPSQIIFLISSGNQFELDMIMISKKLPKPVTSEQWKFVESTGESYFFGESINNTYQLLPRTFEDAYTLLLEAAYLGQRHFFIDHQSLLSSWKIWDPALVYSQSKQPRLYEGLGMDKDCLDFRILNDKSLEFLHKEEIIEVSEMKIPGLGLPLIQQVPSTFHDSLLITGKTYDVIAKLAVSMEKMAKQAIKDRGAFHLALPGGKTPIMLFHYLTTWMPQFPWLHTHIWQVDERCLPTADRESNLYSLSMNLIQHIVIPYFNIHPMPVDLSDSPCSKSDSGDELYGTKLKKLLINSTLDFVLLGVGLDGHIASLFPNQSSLHEADKSVVYSTAAPGVVSPRRMTLTFPALNRSRSIAILIVGREKHSLIQHLAAHENTSIREYPVLGLNPSNHSKLIWYIDDEALFGKS